MFSTGARLDAKGKLRKLSLRSVDRSRNASARIPWDKVRLNIVGVQRNSPYCLLVTDMRIILRR